MRNNSLKKELKVSKEQSVPTNDKQVTANKKQNIVIAWDSMLNDIEDQYNLNTKKANVSIRAFPGSTIEDFKVVDSCWISSTEWSDTFRSFFVYGKTQESGKKYIITVQKISPSRVGLTIKTRF